MTTNQNDTPGHAGDAEKPGCRETLGAGHGLADPPYSLCGGVGHYMSGENYGKICEQCCTHDQGWLELTEHHAGFVEGEDNRCCRAGCGILYRDLKANAKDHTS